jgi:antitoxin Phd
MATSWNLKQAKDHLSAIVDKALAGEPQEIVRRGDPPVVVIAKASLASTRKKRGSILQALTKYEDLDFEIPIDRTDHRKPPKL